MEQFQGIDDKSVLRKTIREQLEKENYFSMNFSRGFIIETFALKPEILLTYNSYGQDMYGVDICYYSYAQEFKNSFNDFLGKMTGNKVVRQNPWQTSFSNSSCYDALEKCQQGRNKPDCSRLIHILKHYDDYFDIFHTVTK